MSNFKKEYLSTYFLVELSEIIQDNVFKNFIFLLKTLSKDSTIEENLKAYNSFVTSLSKANYNDLSKYLKENILKIKTIKNKEQLNKELLIINSILKIDFEKIKGKLAEKFSNDKELFVNLPYFSAHEEITYENDNKKDFDFELFEKNRAFIFDIDLEIKPINVNENIKFSDLKGYIEQKRILKENTNALLSGIKVNNILLYGDAGCGKSSSVRALLNEFKDLKIIQIFKNNLINLDKLFLKLQELPYKFIIFADDISFDESDNALSTMKAILEGSLVGCPKNATIYATSNRRHLIKESFQSRSGDEIHLNDTLNEISSLSERFGINLLFLKPNNEEFNQIVLELAKDNNISIDENKLIERAQRYALIKGSRSPRIAKQLIDNLVAQVNV